MDRFGFTVKVVFPALLTVFSILLMFSPASADWEFGAKYAGEFMSLGADARSAAMGETGTAFTGSASAAYWNPASLTDIDGGAATVMHANRFSGVVKYDFISAAQRFSEREVFGLTLFRLGIDDIPITMLEDPSSPISPENPVLVEEWTTDSELALVGTYALQWRDKWSLGVNGKLISKKVGDNQALGLGFDAGARYALTPSFLVGGRIADVTTTYLGWDTGRNELILPSASIGIMKKFSLRRLEADLALAVDVNFRGENRGEVEQFSAGALSGETHVGIEYTIKNTVSLRGGMDTERFTAGAGLSIGPVAADYAYQSHDGLGESHRISLAYCWKGNPLFRGR